MSLSLLQARTALKRELKSIYTQSEAELIAGWVFEKILGCTAEQLYMHEHKSLSPEKLEELDIYRSRLMDHCPVQYVLGECCFYGLKLSLNGSVLIPRPETEELVDWVLKATEDRHKPLQILDIGTGSGCIALALKAKRPGSTVYAVDQSEDALWVAKKNAGDLGLPLVFHQLDILNEKEWPSLPHFDIIVSNPPYITTEEKTDMALNVLNYEPHEALFVTNDDPLQFYKTISSFARKHLLPGGKLFFEVHSRFATQTRDYLIENGWTLCLKQDMQGRERMLVCYLN